MSYENVPESPGIWSHPDSTNTALLLDRRRSQLGPFIKSYPVFKCPADKSWIMLGGQRYPRVRSYSMNFQVGRYLDDAQSVIRNTRRSEIGGTPWMFIDEHEDTIHEGLFEFNVTSLTPAQIWSWDSVPAARHNGGSVLSFTDGHVEQHKWVDSRTLIPVLRVPQRGIRAP